MVANLTVEALTIPKEISKPLVGGINEGNSLAAPSQDWQVNVGKNKALYRKLLEGKLVHLTRKCREVLEAVLLRYSHVFHDEDTNGFKGTDVEEDRNSRTIHALYRGHSAEGGNENTGEYVAG
jgi:hypothetical protein